MNDVPLFLVLRRLFLYFSNQDPSLRPSDDDRRDAMHEMVCDELIRAILRIIHKLDFTSTKEADSDPEVYSENRYFQDLLCEKS